HWHSNRVCGAERITWIAGHGGPIRIAQSDAGSRWQESDRRDRANVEATQIVFTSHVEALKWRRHQATIPRHERCQEVKADGIVPVLDRNIVLVIKYGPDGSHGPADTRKLCP